jgi:hypothetical protein
MKPLTIVTLAVLALAGAAHAQSSDSWPTQTATGVEGTLVLTDSKLVFRSTSHRADCEVALVNLRRISDRPNDLPAGWVQNFDRIYLTSGAGPSTRTLVFQCDPRLIRQIVSRVRGRAWRIGGTVPFRAVAPSRGMGADSTTG